MFKTVFAAASLALLANVVGCSAATDASDSSANEDLSTHPTGTLSLKDAEAQVGAIRAKFDPKSDNALLFDDTLAPAYLAAVQPIFAQTAPTDKIDLAGDAFTYTSDAINRGAIFDHGLLDDSVATYQQLYDFTFYWGNSFSSDPAFWTKLNGLIARSSAGPLADLQLLELVGNGREVDILTGLAAVKWSAAPKATAATVKTLVASTLAYERLDGALFGDEGSGAHDIDVTNALAVEVFKRSYQELRLFSAGDADGSQMIDLGSHIASVHEYAGVVATSGIALTKSVVTASELKVVAGYFQE